MQGNDITVIIAAYNAAETIHLAVQSALAHPEVREVIVVDDASTDDTASVAKQASRCDPRFDIILFEKNRGPSAARNEAIAKTAAPMIAILDADDIFLPQRFAHLLADQDWDLVADNIVFCQSFDELDALKDSRGNSASLSGITVTLNLQQFVEGNISKRNRQRGELGFIKPIIRREFLQKHNVRYLEDCRLGEDFLLYSECLIKGARLKISGNSGYAALLRNNSLSSGHSVTDLHTLYRHSVNLSRSKQLTPDESAILKRHNNSILRRINHRNVLAVRRQKGILRGILKASQSPMSFVDLMTDKLNTNPAIMQTPRLLFNDEQLAKYMP